MVGFDRRVANRFGKGLINAQLASIAHDGWRPFGWFRCNQMFTHLLAGFVLHIDWERRNQNNVFRAAWDRQFQECSTKTRIPLGQCVDELLQSRWKLIVGIQASQFYFAYDTRKSRCSCAREVDCPRATAVGRTAQPMKIRGWMTFWVDLT